MLILLSDTRKKLLWLWLIGTALITTLVLAQTFSGVYENIIGTAWAWAFINLLPSLILLYVAVLLNKNASKLVLTSVFRVVYIGALAYFGCLLLFMVARPLATFDQSIEAYLRMSYTILVPFQGLLMVLFGLLYFKKESLFRPNAAIIQTYVSKRAESAQQKGSPAQQQAFDKLLNADSLTEVLDFLRSHLKEDTNDIVLLQSQYANWQKDKDLNLTPPDALQRQLNNLTMAVLNYIERL